MADKEQILIQFSKGFNENEVAEIIGALNKIAPTMSYTNQEIQHDCVDSEVIQTVFIIIRFFVDPIAEGFLKSLGLSVYEKMRKALKKQKKAFLQFTYSSKNIRIDINANPERREEWDVIFDTINSTGKLAVNEIEKNNKKPFVIINYDPEADGYWTSG